MLHCKCILYHMCIIDRTVIHIDNYRITGYLVLLIPQNRIPIHI